MILVVGDAMIDRYWRSEVSRVSPEAPCLVGSVKTSEDRAGAAANVCVNIKAMGGEVKGLYSPTFKTNPIIKIRATAGNYHLIRLDFDHPQEPISIKEFEAALEGCSILVISDYGKGALKHIDEMVAIARDRKATILVDPKGYRYSKYMGAAMVKPNLEEMKILIGGWESEDELEVKINAMRVRASIGAILLTRGPEGMTLYNGRATHIPVEAKEVIDVSGAGEAAISAYAVCVSKGMDLEESARFANKAAGLAVGRFGTNVLTRHEVFG